MKNKSKSFSNFKIRELTLSEKLLISKYNYDKDPENKININFARNFPNLKLNLNYKKISNFRSDNKDNLNIKNLTINDNYYNSILDNKKNKEYFQKLYNNENINLSNTNIINSTDYLNFPKNIKPKSQNLFKIDTRNISCKNIFKVKNINIPTSIINHKENSNIPNMKLKLYNDIIKNRLYTNKLSNHNINPNMIKHIKNNNLKIINKKSNPKEIKNKIIFKAVNIIRKKRIINNKKKENKKNINNYFNFSSIYETLELEKIENRNRKPLFKYSSIMTELIPQLPRSLRPYGILCRVHGNSP